MSKLLYLAGTQQDSLAFQPNALSCFRSCLLIGDDYTRLQILSHQRFFPGSDLCGNVSMDLAAASEVPRRNFAKTSGFEDAFWRTVLLRFSSLKAF